MKKMKEAIKTNKMKSACLITIAFLMISIVAITCVPSVQAQTLQHIATVSPTTTTSPEVEYVFNVTNTGTDPINKTNVIYPSGFTYVANEAPTGWTGSHSGSTRSVNFTANSGSEIAASTWKLFNVTLKWPGVPPKTVVLGVDCFLNDTASSNNTVWLSVTFNPKFSATITPTHVKGNTSYVYTITTTNTGSSIGIKEINITYPAGWTFNVLASYSPATWSVSHDPAARVFKLTGPNILVGQSASIQVNMTSPAANADPATWKADVWDMSSTWLGTYNLPVVVDADAPVVVINEPGASVYYTVGSANRIWINTTVTDTLNITKYALTVSINDTRFNLLVTAIGTSANEYKYSFGNITAIADGPLSIKVTATDPAGNQGSAERATTVDNAAPRIVWVKVLDQADSELPYVTGVYWMGATTTAIKVNASFTNAATSITGKIYLNTTEHTFVNATDTSTFSVTGSDYVTLRITLVDSATPTPNNFTQTWEIKRDKVNPSNTTFTLQTICGGAIIRNLNATDNVGVLGYRIYVNGSSFDVSLVILNAPTMTPYGSNVAFNGVLVMGLETFGGKVANITIACVDYGGNEGPPNQTSSSTLVPKGTWCAIELYPEWNLMSLPLIPNSTASADIYSLILDQGQAGVTVTYGFDNEAKAWVKDPTTMTDGNGYWVYMEEYDVLVIQGFTTPPPPATPRTYHLPTGWNLAGFTEPLPDAASDYVESLETYSYFRWVYVWDAQNQVWYMADTDAGGDNLYPGQAFWIYLYVDQDLVPPIAT